MQGWTGFLLWRVGVKRPFKASVNGIKLYVDDDAKRAELSRWLRRFYQAWPLLDEELESGDGFFRLKYRGKILNFQYTKGTRPEILFVLKEFFIKEPYQVLDVTGRDVLDIGANIGDSAIYFCCRGAKRVISLEPYPYFYGIAAANIASNNFQDNIVLLNEGAGRSDAVTIDPGRVVPPWSGLRETSRGKKIKLNKLRDLIDRFGLNSAVLKMNCEGCEYELFENATEEDLSHFSQIMFEYHTGAEPILTKLKAANFATKKWNVKFSFDPYVGSELIEEGYVLATRAG
jgi:FkbM family methyltransferase